MMRAFPLFIVLLSCAILMNNGVVLCADNNNYKGGVKYRPVVLMHGLMATNEAMSHLATWIAQDFPGIYTKNIQIGDSKYDSLLIDMNEQVRNFSVQVAADPMLKDGFDLIGHSQGALLTRGFIERYNYPKVYRYITLAGPNDGVFGIPDINNWCPDVKCPWLVELFDAIFKGGWVSKWMQEHVSFAQYWKDPLNYNDYLKVSKYLADINNERTEKNETYRKHMISLESFTQLRAERDSIVIPSQSEFFEFFKTGQDKIIEPLLNSTAFEQDWIGLKTLYYSKRLTMIPVNCTHQDMPRAACKDTVYEPVVKPLLGSTV